jgi:hypothetical protein
MTGLLAIAASIGAALGLGWLAVAAPNLAARLAAEGAAIEWSQAVLGFIALLISVKSAWRSYRTGRPVVLDILILAGLTGIVIGEVDLDKQVFGVKIIATRFFIDAQVFLPYRVLAVVVVVGVPLALALYALRKWRQLWCSGWEALEHTWGRILLAAVVTFGGTQILERPLGRVPGFPRSFLEESLELIAAIWFLVAAIDRRRVQARELENAAPVYSEPREDQDTQTSTHPPSITSDGRPRP